MLMSMECSDAKHRVIYVAHARGHAVIGFIIGILPTTGLNAIVLLQSLVLYAWKMETILEMGWNLSQSWMPIQGLK